MRKKTLSILLLSLLLTGCDKEIKPSESVPDLEHPIASGESYFPVMLGDVDMPDIRSATVKCMEYGQTFDKAQDVETITVNVGDTVKKGDILAYADCSVLKAERDRLKQELAAEVTEYDINVLIEKARLENMKLYADKNIKIQIAEWEENQNYKAILHSKRVENYQNRIDSLEQEISENVIRANHSGMVVYTKNLNSGLHVTPTTNVVVIADENDRFLELELAADKANSLNKKKNRFIYFEGKEIPVKELPFTGAELVLAKLYGSYPKLRFTFDGIERAALGLDFDVYFIDENKKDVKVIYADSVYGDTEKYVYVKGAGGAREKRVVTLGNKYKNYVEVLAGLEIGEPVLYSSKELIPTGDNYYVVSTSEINTNNNSYFYYYSEADTCTYYSELEGEIVDVSPVYEKNREVKKGDYLYTMDIGIGKAKLQEKMYEIVNANEDYINAVAAYDKMITENYKSYLECGDAVYMAYLIHENEIIGYEKQLLEINHSRAMEAMDAEYEQLLKVNDGNGRVKVFAENSGSIKDVYKKKGDKVAMGDLVYSISYVEGKNIRMEMVPFPTNVPKFCDENNIADIGERISIKVGNDTYMGTCIGYYGYRDSLGKPYIMTEDGKQLISFNSQSTYNKNGFYVRLDDESALDKVIEASGTATRTNAAFPYRHYENAIVLPNEKMVKTEKNDSYVWVMRDGYVFKQYVICRYIQNDSGKNIVVILAGLKAGDRVVY